MKALALCSSELLNKYGFDDGDIVYGWLADNGLDPIKFDFNSRGILEELVRRYLLPELNCTVEIRRMNSHNPVRAATINGQPFDAATAPYEDMVEWRQKLVPKVVFVPGDAVMELIKEQKGNQ